MIKTPVKIYTQKIDAGLETQLNKISNISVSQGMFGKMLDYGTVTIASTGGVKESYKCIERPIEFKKKIQEYIEQH